MRRVRKAIIPAAGLGTRFLPATKAIPKEMLILIDKPAIQYIVEEAVQSGIEAIIIVTSRSKRSIEDHFNKNIELELNLIKKKKPDLLHVVNNITNLADIHFVRQKEPLGLGHAVWCARKLIGNEPFALLLGDMIFEGEVPCLKQLVKIYETYGKSAIGVEPVPQIEASQYGLLIGEPMNSENLYRVRHFIEKPLQPPPSPMAITGRYILSPSIFEILEKQPKPSKGEEIQLTDAINELAQREEVLAYRYEGKMFDVGSKLGYLKAVVEYAYKNPELGRSFDEFIRAFLVGKEGKV